MAAGFASRRVLVLCVAGIIAAGILSRVVHTGIVAIDKYLGDILYAAMVCGLFRVTTGAVASAAWATAVMIALELFQLTLIPAHMASSGYLVVRICARLLGTDFSFRDLLAYAVGIAGFYFVDTVLGKRAVNPAA